MRTPLVYLAAGAALGIGIVVACSDDSPSDADAAVCECPAAEPPLSGRVVLHTTTVPLPPQSNEGDGRVCDAGGMVLTGGCRFELGSQQITLTESGINVNGTGWSCRWNNPTDTPSQAFVQVACLYPPE
jgi:hypothetical protein